MKRKRVDVRMFVEISLPEGEERAGRVGRVVAAITLAIAESASAQDVAATADVHVQSHVSNLDSQLIGDEVRAASRDYAARRGTKYSETVFDRPQP